MSNLPDFMASIMPGVMAASARTGIDPRIIAAQAYLESGGGQHKPGNNLFGIKGNGPAGSNMLTTHEVVNGMTVPERASFAAYNSPAESINGYADFILKNPRYKPVMAAQGMENQLAALQQSGYATDPHYAEKLRNIATRIQVPAQASGMAFNSPQQTTIAPVAPAQPSTQQQPTILAQLHKRMGNALTGGFPGVIGRLGQAASLMAPQQAPPPMLPMQQPQQQQYSLADFMRAFG